MIVEYDKFLGKGRPLTLLRNYILMIPGIQIIFFAFKLQVLKYGPWWKALHKYYFCALLMKASESYITIKNVCLYVWEFMYYQQFDNISGCGITYIIMKKSKYQLISTHIKDKRAYILFIQTFFTQWKPIIKQCLRKAASKYEKSIPISI